VAQIAEAPILVVDDDRKTTALIGAYLEKDGFRAVFAHDGPGALEAARRHGPALVILDLMMPRTDGWEVCRELCAAGTAPVLVLTAREEELDRVLAFTLGADDYVVKPFSPRELVARVKAILRRVGNGRPATTGRLRRDDLILDPDKRTLTRRGQPVALTPSEYKLLCALMAAPGRVFLREELLNRLYPVGDPVIDRVIDVHIGKLRQKIEPDPARPRYVLTVRGVGYQFAEPPPVGEGPP